MLPRRIATAIVIAVVLGGIVWFARREPESGASALDAPAQSEAVRTDPGATPIESQHAGDTRSEAVEPAATEKVPAKFVTPLGTPRLGGDEDSGLLVRVLDPAGKPLPGALLSSVSGGKGPLNVGMPGPTDLGGCRLYRVRAGEWLDLRASDSRGRYAPAYAFGLDSERRKLDMQLEASTSHTLVVVDEQGTPVERFAWRLLDERQYVSHLSGKILLDENGRLRDLLFERMGTGSFTPTEQEQQTHPGGRVELRVGSLAFAVQVEAADFGQAQVGPMAAGDAPSEIRVVLQRLPGIRGRVVCEGKGVPGAWVKLLRPTPSGRTQYINGFPADCDAWPVAESTTDDAGRFALQLRQTGEYLVRAGAKGLCLAEIGPQRFEAHRGAEGLELVLPAAGAIEGRLLLAPGESEREWIIGASRGDGLARTVHTDAEGRFRFESLSPGDWLLRPTSEDLDPDSIQSVSDGGDLDGPTPTTCVVRAGESTHVEFDLRVGAVLNCNLELPGWEKSECWGELEALSGTFSRSARFESNPPGSVRAVVDQPGEYRLRISLRGEDHKSNIGLVEQVRLAAGENSWKSQDAAGELVLVNTLEVEQWATLRCELGETRRSSVNVNLAAGEARTVRGLPVGRWILLKREGGSVREDASVEVVTTAAARLELR